MTGFGYRWKNFDNGRHMQCRRHQGEDPMCVGDLEVRCCRSDVKLLVLTDRLAAGLRRRHLLGAALVSPTAATRMLPSVQKPPWNKTRHGRHPNKSQHDGQRSESTAALHALQTTPSPDLTHRTGEGVVSPAANSVRRFSGGVEFTGPMNASGCAGGVREFLP